MSAAAGMVTIHAITMLPATPQRTACARCAAPTPTMAPVIVCVVETGMPKLEARNSVIAPPVSAAKPPTGRSLVIFWPMVLTMRQPPNIVPSADRDVAADDHPAGRLVACVVTPAAISSSQMMPMVFCASLLPWPML